MMHKNLLSKAALALSVVLMAACSNENAEMLPSSESLQEAKGFRFITSQESVGTRATLSEDLVFSWEPGDSALVHNFSRNVNGIATASVENGSTYFDGAFDFTKGEKISLFFPAPDGKIVSYDSDPKYLDVNLTQQEGTRWSMANKSLLEYGVGSVIGTFDGLENVTAHVRYANSLFIVKMMDVKSGTPIRMKHLEITGGTTKGRIYLEADSADQCFQADEDYATEPTYVNLPTADTVCYVAMLPTKDTLSLTIRVTDENEKTYVDHAKIEGIENSRVYRVNLSNETVEPTWAPGNFYVCNPCRPNSPCSYAFYCQPWESNLYKCKQHYELFRWGVLGRGAWDATVYVPDPCPADPNIDISGKMYTDRQMTHETTNFCEARYGDIVYWASRGKWRIPTQAELSALMNDSSTIYGSYAYAYNYYFCYTLRYYYAQGVSFQKPENGEAQHPAMQYCRRLSWNDVYRHVFLPMAQYMYRKSYCTCAGTRYSTTMYGGWCNVMYMSSTLNEGMVDSYRFGPYVNTSGLEVDDEGQRNPRNIMRERFCRNNWYVPIRAVKVNK
jgi:hypothetical protein